MKHFMKWKRFFAVALMAMLLVTAISVSAAAQANSYVEIRCTSSSVSLRADKPSTYEGYDVTYTTKYGLPAVKIDLGTYNVNNKSFRIPELSTFFDVPKGCSVNYVMTDSGQRSEKSSILLKNSGNHLVYYLKGTPEPETKTATIKVYGRGDVGGWSGPTASNPKTYEVKLDQKLGSMAYGYFTIPSLESAGFAITDPTTKFSHCTTSISNYQQPGTTVRVTEYDSNNYVIYEFEKKSQEETAKDFTIYFADEEGRIPSLSYDVHFDTYGSKTIDFSHVYRYLAENYYTLNPIDQSQTITYSSDGSFSPTEVVFTVSRTTNTF